MNADLISWPKFIALQFVLALVLAGLVPVLIKVLSWLPFHLGWQVIPVTLGFLPVLLILFYVVSTRYSFWLSAVSFMVCIGLLVLELAGSYEAFGDTWMFETVYAIIGVGGMLCALNKIIADKIYAQFNFKIRMSWLDRTLI